MIEDRPTYALVSQRGIKEQHPVKRIREADVAHARRHLERGDDCAFDEIDSLNEGCPTRYRIYREVLGLPLGFDFGPWRPGWDEVIHWYDVTDEEWREFQSLPDQGHSHRAVVDSWIAKRLAAVPTVRVDTLASKGYTTCRVIIDGKVIFDGTTGEPKA